MIIRRLNINRLPGIENSFSVEFSGAGFHIIHGPNGIGKSSLCKAIQYLYWNDAKKRIPVSVAGQFEFDGDLWLVERDISNYQWSMIDGKESAAPDLPPNHQSKYFFLQLRDLMDPSQDSVTDIAAQINRQMAGGYDLDGVVKAYPAVSQYNKRKFDKAFSAASRGVEKEKKEQTSLQSNEDRLSSLETNLSSFKADVSRKASVERALGMLGRQKELDGLNIKIANYPANLSKLIGDEADRIRALEEKSNRYSEQVKQLEVDMLSAENAFQDTKLSAPLDSELLIEQKTQADELIRHETSIEIAKSEIAANEGKLKTALKVFGKAVDANRIFNLQEHLQIYEFLGKYLSIQSQKEHIESTLALLEKNIIEHTGDNDPSQLDIALSALRMWLRAPATEATQHIKHLRKKLLVAGGIVLLLGILSIFPSFLAKTDAIIAVGLCSILASMYLIRIALGSSSSATAESREHAEATFKLGKIKGPDEWDVPSVKTLVSELERKQSTIKSGLEYAQLQTSEKQRLEHELAGLNKKHADIEVQRQKLADELGLGNIPVLQLVECARILENIREIQMNLKASQSQIANVLQDRNQLLEQLTAYLIEHGGQPPSGGIAAKTKIDSLNERNQRYEKALLKKKSAEQQIQRLDSEKIQAEQDIQKIFADLSLEHGDMLQLNEMLELRDEYLDLRNQISNLKSQIDLDLQELESAGDLNLHNLQPGELLGLKEQCEKAEQKVEEISREIAEINTLINAAKKGSSMQDLIAAREEKRVDLQEAREKELHARAVHFLINQVKSQYQEKRMPRLLERARDHFSRFTRHAYELQLSHHEGKPTLRAIELQSGKFRELEELSDGTRVQLLIAARLSFAEEIERGNTMPLFLDEALDQSDPQRFEAIVRSLGQICQDQGRQIVYLTSDPVDEIRIKHALEQEGCKLSSTIDLGKTRNMSTRVDDLDKLRFNLNSSIPEPSGKSFQEYGMMLDVPEFRPINGWHSQHFFYLLPEQKDVLHRFVKNGIQFAGQWDVVKNQPLAKQLCSDFPTPEEVANRIELLKVFCNLWSIGRGRPVDQHDIENSSAISNTYIQAVSKIAQEVKGDAPGLINTLNQRADPRLKGIRQEHINNLEQYLLNTGHIDDRETLETEELLLKARFAPAASKLSEDTCLSILDNWLTWAKRFAQTQSKGYRL